MKKPYNNKEAYPYMNVDVPVSKAPAFGRFQGVLIQTCHQRSS